MSLISRKEHRLSVFENRLLRRIFKPKRKQQQEAGENCVRKNFLTFTFHQIFFFWSQSQANKLPLSAIWLYPFSSLFNVYPGFCLPTG
jgi:hypothetical protein